MCKHWVWIKGTLYYHQGGTILPRGHYITVREYQGVFHLLKISWGSQFEWTLNQAAAPFSGQQYSCSSLEKSGVTEWWQGVKKFYRCACIQVNTWFQWAKTEHSEHSNIYYSITKRWLGTLLKSFCIYLKTAPMFVAYTCALLVNVCPCTICESWGLLLCKINDSLRSTLAQLC